MNRWLKATLDYWEAKKTEAEATLETYLQDTVGIGEHSEILEELVKWSERLAVAEDTLKTLRAKFDDDGSLKSNRVSKNKELLND
jgi:hypothetical protein